MATLFPIALQPNRADVRIAALEQRVLRMTVPTNNQYVAPAAAVPAWRLNLSFVLQSRAEIAALRDWFDTVYGRWKALWVPTFRNDVTLAVSAAATDTAVTIVAMGYTDTYSAVEARRHLAFIQPDGTTTHRRVTAAVDNLDGTETLTLSSALGTAWAAGAGLVSFLLYARLDDDVLRLTRHHGDAAEADLAFLELPQETPES